MCHERHPRHVNTDNGRTISKGKSSRWTSDQTSQTRGRSEAVEAAKSVPQRLPRSGEADGLRMAGRGRRAGKPAYYSAESGPNGADRVHPRQTGGPRANLLAHPHTFPEGLRFQSDPHCWGPAVAPGVPEMVPLSPRRNRAPPDVPNPRKWYSKSFRSSWRRGGLSQGLAFVSGGRVPNLLDATR
jgi:hypothetical protein